MSQRRNDLSITQFPDHQIITPPNPLLAAIDSDAHEADDPVARAEAALASLSSEFASWMAVECERLSLAYAAVRKTGIDAITGGELFRAAHDIKGDAATFGFPAAAGIADSLCRLIEYAPDLARMPRELIGHHVDAIRAIVREGSTSAGEALGDELARRLRGVADTYLANVNRDQPDQLQAVLSPSLAPG